MNSAKYSTLKNITFSVPKIAPKQFVSKYLNYPDLTGKRFAQGGLRTKKKFKRTIPKFSLVSVITVSLNSVKTLEQCILSVLRQTYENIEYIIIDGGSTDGTLNLLRKYEGAIDYFVSECDRGLYHAMNKGLELATGEYILILNSDDWYAEDCIESLVQAKISSRADFVSSLAEYVDQSGKSLYVTRNVPFDAGLRLRMPLRHETMLLPSFIYNDVGLYNEEYKVIADFYLTIRIFEKGYSHYLLQRPLLFFRNTGVSSINMEKLHFEREKILRCQFPYLDQASIKVLAGYGKLDPNNLREIVEKYKNKSDLMETLNCYIRDQQRSGAVRWKDFDIKNFFRNVYHPMSLQSHPSNFLTGSKQKNIRVGVFNTLDKGGAAIGSIRRILALRNSGINATLHPLVSESSWDFVMPLLPKSEQDIAWEKVRKYSILRAKNEPGYCSQEMFSLPYSIIDYTKYTRLFASLDILHLHWVVGIFDYQNAGKVLGDKPVVWTLADMNAFTGGCHYSQGCEEYQRECKCCPLLGGNSNLAHEGWKIKKRAYSRIKNLEIICPSAWLAEKVKKSTLLGDRKIHIIPNAYPTQDFTPVNKLAARIKLNLPFNKKLVLFGADSLSNLRKGGDLLADALKSLKNISSVAENIEVVTYGKNSIDLPFFTHCLGFLKTSDQLKLAYSACDVYIFPSREDNAPLTVGESLLCGTPVVAFPVGNVPELITHKKNGYIATYNNVLDLAEGIRWITKEVNNRELLNMSIYSRLIAANYHNPAVAAEKHIAVYEKMLSVKMG